MSGRGCKPMSRNKDCYLEITKKIKKIKEWIKNTDDYITKGNEYIEQYELQRRQKNETDNK